MTSTLHVQATTVAQRPDSCPEDPLSVNDGLETPVNCRLRRSRPGFRNDAAHRNGMIPPGGMEGDERRRWPDEVGSFGSPKGADDASGKSAHARGARDHSPEVCELKRKHVTLQIVWDEYIAAHPGGYSYSRFCELYRGFEKTLSPTMRHTHAAGERLFVDYAGDGVSVVIDRLTGEVRMAQIFVAVLGASSFTFAHASWTQTLSDWIDAHVRALTAIGGVPQLIVPDNTKTAVIKACLYDPQVNRTYAEMAAHYGSAILPARPRKPRDKSKVEQAILIVERWLIGPAAPSNLP